jgi:peptide chain release factor 2
LISSGGIFDVDKVHQKLAEIEKKLSREDIWTAQEQAQHLLKEKASLENILIPYNEITEKIEDLSLILELLQEEGGEVFYDDIKEKVSSLRLETEDLELRSIMVDPHDKANAIVTIHPGAGGTESQDWAQMLMRMYVRWAERWNFQVSIVDSLLGDVAGIKSATLTIAGQYAYGYIKAEAGIHRLVRISPFDSNKRRHTSFSAILVYPEIEEDLDIDINPDDLKIDTYRASGAGGQHVNKTSSAVRITHLPTNIVVSCQNERSQHKNKATAMKILMARLFDMKKKEQDEQLEEMKGEKKDISWGSQIRSYILQPYQLVKDHRTGRETGNVDAVLDGYIDQFIKEYLLLSKRQK